MLRRYENAGWTFVHQRGSHVRVEKNSQHETIPMHKELKKGMEQKLLKRLNEGGT
jgi:predicted RNA binding protein YcfA (HicA-like mRNA interferase family)